MLLLGTIKDIFEEYMIISLPDNIYGYVYLCDINEIISEKLKKVQKVNDK